MSDFGRGELKKPRPRWRVWPRRLGVTLLALVLVEAGRYGVNHYQVTTRLRAALDELNVNDPGWRLAELEAARAAVQDNRNGAACVVAAARLLPRDWPGPEYADAFEALPPAEALPADQFARLRAELDRLGPALKEARKLADRPHGRHRIDYRRNVLATPLHDQAQTRRVARLLRDDALSHQHRGDLAAALASGRAALNAARALGDEPCAVSQLIRVAGVSVACQSVERTLAQGEPAGADLADLQRRLAEEDAHPGAWVAARGERALMHELFDALESGEVNLSQAGGNDNTPPSWQERCFAHIIRDRFRGDHPLLLSLLTRAVAVAGLPPHEQADAERAFRDEARGLPESATVARLLLPALDKVFAACRRKHAQVRCLVAALAAERYRQKHGRWPESLAGLAPDYLAAVPLDPFDGQPLRYRRLADGVVVYSVGVDKTDDGGNIDRKNPHQSGTDLGCRLWDVGQRRRPAQQRPVGGNP
jgi:hypothetical protein